MPRKSKKANLPFDRRRGVVSTQRILLESSAWISLSAQAKSLMALMQQHWRNDKPVAYGVREAMLKIPCAKRTAQNAFAELEAAGFIRQEDEHVYFDERSQRKSRTWRLTWMPYNGKFPTNDWEQ